MLYYNIRLHGEMEATGLKVFCLPDGDLGVPAN